jgi:hypothetical protein
MDLLLRLANWPDDQAFYAAWKLDSAERRVKIVKR